MDGMNLVIKTLQAEYPGDEAWDTFAKLYLCDDQPLLDHLAELLGDRSMANVICTKLGAQAEQWIGRPLSALEGNSVQGLINSGPDGAIAIRSMLMRMPV